MTTSQDEETLAAPTADVAEPSRPRPSRRTRKTPPPSAPSEGADRPNGVLKELWADLRGRPRSWTQPGAWDDDDPPQTHAPGPGWSNNDMERLQRRYWSN